MPADPPRGNHNTGPPTFGQPQSGQHPHHIPPAPQAAQYPHPVGHRVPPHQQHPIQHVSNSPLNTPQSQYGGMPQARPMPPLPNPQPTPAAPLQPPPGRPMHAPYYIGGFMNNDYTAQITQPYLSGPFLYSQPYYPATPTAPAQTQPAMNVRPPRHMSQPVPNSNPPRPPGRVSVPKSTKRIIAIVDPETNEEIKPEKASAIPTSSAKSSPPSAVKIEPRASRPLSLTPDPSDSPASVSQKSEIKSKISSSVDNVPTPELPQRTEDNPIPASDTVKSEVPKPLEAIDSDASNRNEDLTEDSSVSRNVTNTKSERTTDDIVLTSESEGPSEQQSTQQGNLSDRSNSVDHLNDNQEVTSSKQTSSAELNPDGSKSADITSTLAEMSLDSTNDPASTKIGNVLNDSNTDLPDQSTASEKKVENDVMSSEDRKENESHFSDASDKEETKHHAAQVPEPSSTSSEVTHQDNVAEVPDSESVNTNDLSETESNGAKNEEDSVDTMGEDSSKDGDDVDSTDTSELASGVMVFKPGQRRVYPPAFMYSMRDTPNPKKVLEFQKSMTSTDIFKTDNSGRRSNPRDVRGGRGGFALPSDPRGRAFPSPMGFGNSRGAIPMSGSNVSADSIDLSRARSQPPPEVPKAPNSIRSGDPRGTRTQLFGRNDRFQGPSRPSHTPVDPFIRRPPVEKLKRGENAWQRNKEEDDEITMKIKQVRSLLNKLTLEKFEKIFQQIVDIDISSFEILTGIVKEIFEKTLFEPKFSDMYAELCRRLDQTVQPKLDEKEGGGGKSLNFRRILLNNCKDEFTRFANSNVKTEKAKGDSSAGDGEKDESSSGEKSDMEESSNGKENEGEDEELKALKAKRRMLANIRFIGELYLKDLLVEKIIHKHILQKLLTMAAETLEEDFLEAVCKLLSKTGSKLSANPGAAEFINRYFDVLNRLSRDKNMPARLRFMIEDLNDQRRNNWKVRREEVAAKTISEIHADIRREEQVKEEAQNAMRERRNRGQGGRMDHGRGGSSGSARVAMTMANISRTPSSGMSRTNAMLERHLNRSASTSSTPMQPVRLGPGGRGGYAGGSTPSLRPQSVGSRYSPLAPDSQDRGTGVSGNTDLRRSRAAVARPSGPVRKTVPKMDPEKLKRKSRSILEEYWSIGSLEEVQSCLSEEFETSNYSAFVDEIVKLSFECNKNQNLKSRTLFGDLVKKKVLPTELFLDSFEKWGPEIPNVEVDFPIATELFAGLVAAVVLANHSQDHESGDHGLNFLKTIFNDAEEKGGPCKLIVMVCAGIYDQAKGSGEESAKALALNIYRSLNLDLAMEMIAWDDLFGPKLLSSALDRAKVPFLISTFQLEMQLRELLGRKGDANDIYDLLQSDPKTQGEENTIDVVKMVIRVTLDVTLNQETEEENLEKVFKEQVAPALLKKFSQGNNLSMDMQFGALCSAQLQLARNDSKMPSTVGDQSCASAVFEVLYHSDLVDEPAFRHWKNEERVSLEIPGKEKMLVDTSKFFTWLDEAEEE